MSGLSEKQLIAQLAKMSIEKMILAKKLEMVKGVGKMTLTDKWKKGELPNGMYYIEFKDGDIAKDVYAFGSWGNINEHFLKQVLAPVPSYEEWKSTGKFAMEAMKVAEENQQLKELLKECRNLINECISGDYMKELCERIDEVLK